MANLSLLDTVTNLIPIPQGRVTLVEPQYQSLTYLPAGQVGTVVEIYFGTNPGYLVEFADANGREYAIAVLQEQEILSLHYELSLAS